MWYLPSNLRTEPLSQPFTNPQSEPRLPLHIDHLAGLAGVDAEGLHAAGVAVPLEDLLALTSPTHVGQVVQLGQPGPKLGEGGGGGRDWDLHWAADLLSLGESQVQTIA